jgi:hypothetical protein
MIVQNETANVVRKYKGLSLKLPEIHLSKNPQSMISGSCFTTINREAAKSDCFFFLFLVSHHNQAASLLPH